MVWKSVFSFTRQFLPPLHSTRIITGRALVKENRHPAQVRHSGLYQFGLTLSIIINPPSHKHIKNSLNLRSSYTPVKVFGPKMSRAETRRIRIRVN